MTITTKVAPDFLYYALVDGTREVDSVAFAENLTLKKGFGGWRNLLDFLQTNPYEDTRLVDGAHIYLPIIKLDRRAKPAVNGVAVMCPGGSGGVGMEDDWKTYEPGPHQWEIPPKSLNMTAETFGRHTAAEESAAMVSDFILDPSVQVDSSGVASIMSGRPVKPDATVFRASLLYVSSHGWLGGFMKGEGLAEWPAAEPAEARKEYVPFHSYFLVGRADAQGKHFTGPRWIVLAQCSTLNSATWAMWARVMANSDPPVHGILGYEESSPAAGASIGIADRFFAALRERKSFLDAWKTANAGQHWAAIVHRDAHADTLKTFPANRLPKPALADYIGYLPSIRKGEAITDPPPPFTTQLFRVRKDPTQPPVEVTRDALDLGQAKLGGGSNYIINVSSTQPFKRATVRFVHIRATYDQQFGHGKIFEEITSSTPGANVDLRAPMDIAVQVPAGSTSIDLKLKTHPEAKLARSGLHASHSYLWLAVTIQLASGAKQQHDFKTLGLLYG